MCVFIYTHTHTHTHTHIHTLFVCVCVCKYKHIHTHTHTYTHTYTSHPERSHRWKGKVSPEIVAVETMGVIVPYSLTFQNFEERDVETRSFS